MIWEDVRKMYPNQYVKITVLKSHMEDDKKIVTDVALVNIIADPRTAAKELMKSKDDTIVYHTGSDKIVIEMRQPAGFRSIR